MLKTKELSFEINKRAVLESINLSVTAGEIVGVIGPSGAGKSTLLKLLSGELPVNTGSICVNDTSISKLGSTSKYKTISYYNNSQPNNFDENVYDFILLARTPYKKILRPFSESDLQITENTINHFNLNSYRQVPIAMLPHSILKRTLLAHMFNRDPSILALDNPDNELDIKSMSLFRKAMVRFVMDGERSIIMTSNNINFISQTADRIILLDQGTVIKDDTVNIITAELLKKHFNVEVIISHNIYNGRPEVHIFPEN